MPRSDFNLFYQVKDVKSYLENFGNFNLKGLGCQKCGNKDVIRSGKYFRKKPGIPIQRIKCKHCGRSLAWLPPFVLRNKHYTVHELQGGIEKYVAGSQGYGKILLSLPAGMKESVETLRNWVDYFATESRKLYSTARSILAELKPRSTFENDKRLLKYSFPPARSKAKTNGLVHLYQIFVIRDYFAYKVDPEDFLVWLIFVSRLRENKKSKTTQFGTDNNGQIGNNSS